jgi:hypothetical protein
MKQKMAVYVGLTVKSVLSGHPEDQKLVAVFRQMAIQDRLFQ